MAKKDEKKVAWRGFVPYRLTAEERERFKEFNAENETPPTALLVTLFDQGLKVTASSNPENESFIISCTGTNLGGDWAGYTHSSFASDIDTAIRLAYFKHVVLWSEKGLPEQANDPEERFG